MAKPTAHHTVAGDKLGRFVKREKATRMYRPARRRERSVEARITDVVAGKERVSTLSFPDLSERVEAIRIGLPAGVVEQFSSEMHRSKEWVYEALGVQRQTALRKVKENAALDSAASERGVCIAGLIHEVEAMTQLSRPVEFGAASWVGEWLSTPHPALGNKAPSSYLDTDAGRQIVSRLLKQVEGGAYA